jgi:tRNA pseudouridine38-40 synthase
MLNLCSVFSAVNSMPRYAFLMEYDGTAFHGWQNQKGLITVQQTLEEALTSLLNERVTVFGSGRTDAGVHAVGQVAHIETQGTYTLQRLRLGLNQIIPAELRHALVIRAVAEVPNTFHARFSATQRVYHYHVIQRASPLVLQAKRAWWIRFPLKLSDMQEACSHLQGHHDFSAFRSMHCQANSPIKTLHEASVRQEGESVRFVFRAPSFLHHQVRRMVGALVHVGMGIWSPSDFRQYRDGRIFDAPRTAAPYGLYFMQTSFAEFPALFGSIL